MASLTDLFNPTFLMFLGILVLVVALLVVYFESKMREQNHKINSMFSIVSTLAENVTGLQAGVNHLSIMSQQNGGNSQEHVSSFNKPLEKNRDTKLITVSDDEYESDDEESVVSEESDNEINADPDADADTESIDSINDELEINSADDLSMNDLSDDSNEEEHIEQIKVFKINVESAESVEDVDAENVDAENVDAESVGLSDLEDLEEKPVEPIVSQSELKTISINLEEPVEKIDYKKLQLPKLRSIVVEKGLATSTDASKLKKGELLKLLGIE